MREGRCRPRYITGSRQWRAPATAQHVEAAPPFTAPRVNQLRHSRGTEVRKQYGVEGAQAVLGHVRADVTQVYAQKSLELAMKIARETG